MQQPPSGWTHPRLLLKNGRKIFGKGGFAKGSYSSTTKSRCFKNCESLVKNCICISINEIVHQYNLLVNSMLQLLKSVERFHFDFCLSGHSNWGPDDCLKEIHCWHKNKEKKETKMKERSPCKVITPDWLSKDIPPNKRVFRVAPRYGPSIRLNSRLLWKRSNSFEFIAFYLPLKNSKNFSFSVFWVCIVTKPKWSEG
jgi:hypothetical protein